MRRTALVAAAITPVLALVAGCGHHTAGGSGDAPGATGSGPQAVTQRAVDRLLADAPLPAGARDATTDQAQGKGPQSTPAEDDHLVTAHQVYVVPLGLDDAASWFTAHPPAGLEYSGTSAASGSDGVTSHGVEFDGRGTRTYGHVEQQVGVFPLDDSHSIVRIDVQADWFAKRTAAEHIPDDVTSVVGVRVTRNPTGVRHFRLTGPPVGQLAHMINHLRPVQLFGIVNCPNDTGAHDRFEFLGASGSLVVRVAPSGCAWVDVSADGVRQPVLEGGYAVDQLLGRLLARA